MKKYICNEKLFTTPIICLIMLHPGIVYQSDRVQTNALEEFKFRPLFAAWDHSPFCVGWILMAMYDMQVDRLRESLIQSLLIFNDLTSDGVWKYGHINVTKHMCHR